MSRSITRTLPREPRPWPLSPLEVALIVIIIILYCVLPLAGLPPLSAAMLVAGACRTATALVRSVRQLPPALIGGR